MALQHSSKNQMESSGFFICYNRRQKKIDSEKRTSDNRAGSSGGKNAQNFYCGRR